MPFKKDVEHGSNTMYGRGCRCDPCKKAHNDRLQFLRDRVKAGLPKLRDKKLRHGTISGYGWHRCRCPKCKKTNSDYQKAQRDKKPKKPKIPKEWAHGVNGYKHHGCRCDICKAAYSKSQKAFRDSHKELVAKRKKKYYDNNKEKALAAKRKYYLENRSKIIERRAKYREANRDKINKRHRELSKTRVRPLNERLANSLRARLTMALRAGQKAGSAVRDLGCTLDEFRTWIESQFSEGMSWANWGWGMDKWNIDHIMPLCNFDLSKRDQVLIACHYTNQRPLWQKDNFSRPNDGSDIPNLFIPKKKSKKSKKKS